MDSENNKPTLSLDPIDPPAAAGSVPPTDGARPPLPRIASSDRFLAQAAEEYEKGIVDEPLWRSAVAQTQDDQALVVAAYLRARATALQIQHRSRRAESRVQAADAPRPTAPAATPRPQAPARPNRKGALPARTMVAIAGVIGVVLAAGAAWLGFSDDERPVEVTAATTVRRQAVASAAPAAEAAKAEALNAAVQAAAEREALVQKVASLEQTGNWNVQVLYAAEWTRKEPTNAEAWSRLAAGYQRLDQLDEAYEAAKRAVQEAPDDAKYWARLGHLYLVLQRPKDASDALERALAIDADHADALCGALALAESEGRLKDANGYRDQLGPREATCERHDEAPVAQTVDASQVARPAKPRGR